MGRNLHISKLCQRRLLGLHHRLELSPPLSLYTFLLLQAVPTTTLAQHQANIPTLSQLINSPLSYPPKLAIFLATTSNGNINKVNQFFTGHIGGVTSGDLSILDAIVPMYIIFG